MANEHFLSTSISFLLFIIAILFGSSNADYNVYNYGAKSDGKTDSTKAFLNAWNAACSSANAATIIIPKGTYMIKSVTFRGPCKNSITIRNSGTIVAPLDYRALGNSGYWILFIKVNKVSMYGGTLDARAANYWACRKSGKSCPVPARSITFNWANNILISGLTSINSQITHIVINRCNNVALVNTKVSAPADSPNTDGIHIQFSTGVTITSGNLQTGDDCISIGPGSKNLWMSKINCGPGHGVSIGSLAKSLIEDGVQNVTLSNAVFSGSDNGVRIKSWARPSNGFVTKVVFQNIVMKNVKNPIIIDQNYCPSGNGCSSQSSGVKISQVTYKNIKGSSATKSAVVFACSSSKPCTGIRLQDVMLTYMNLPASSTCTNIMGTKGGVIMPNSCL